MRRLRLNKSPTYAPRPRSAQPLTVITLTTAATSKVTNAPAIARDACIRPSRRKRPDYWFKMLLLRLVLSTAQTAPSAPMYLPINARYTEFQSLPLSSRRSRLSLPRRPLSRSLLLSTARTLTKAAKHVSAHALANHACR